jgi:hypothetical protein
LARPISGAENTNSRGLKQTDDLPAALARGCGSPRAQNIVRLLPSPLSCANACLCLCLCVNISPLLPWPVSYAGARVCACARANVCNVGLSIPPPPLLPPSLSATDSKPYLNPLFCARAPSPTPVCVCVSVSVSVCVTPGGRWQYHGSHEQTLSAVASPLTPPVCVRAHVCVCCTHTYTHTHTHTRTHSHHTHTLDACLCVCVFACVHALSYALSPHPHPYQVVLAEVVGAAVIKLQGVMMCFCHIAHLCVCVCVCVCVCLCAHDTPPTIHTPTFSSNNLGGGEWVCVGMC